VRGHVDPETLAAFREELLPRRKAGQVAAHLAECPRCAGLDAQLADLPALLAHAPAPPMPDALTSRIEAALAAEAAARSAQAPDGVPGTEPVTGASAPPPGPRLPGNRQAGDRQAGPRDADGAGRRRPRRPAGPGRSRLALRIAVATAAVLVIAGGGYGVSRLVSGGVSGAGASSATAPGAAAPAAGGAAASRSVMGPAQRSGTSPSSEHHAAAGSAAAYPVVASGTNYRASQLKTQVKATLTRFSAAVPGSETSAPAPLTSGLAACLAGVTGGQRPRLVDLASYEGRPATVVVVPAGAHTLRALVFSRPCPAAGAGLLDSTTLPSPG
jgi:hypothetical protein